MAGLWGGASLSLAVILGSSTFVETGHSLEEFTRALLLGFIIIFPTYLISARYGLSAGKVSVKEIVWGKWWPLFWIVVVLFGILLPVGVVISTFVVGLEGIPIMVLYLSIAFELLSDLVLRYLILKNGFYNPLVPRPISYGSM